MIQDRPRSLPPLLHHIASLMCPSLFQHPKNRDLLREMFELKLYFRTKCLHKCRAFPGDELELEPMIGTHRWAFGVVPQDAFTGPNFIGNYLN